MGMYSKSGGISKKQIALIHVAKRDLGLTDDEYRSVLALYGDCESAAELDFIGFSSVMKYFTACGFRSSWTKRTYGSRPGMATPAQVDLIRSLWCEYVGKVDANDAGLNNWLEKHHKVTALRFVSSEKASKVIYALKKMASRKSKTKEN